MRSYAKGQVEFYHFSGDEEMNTTLDNTAVSDQTSSYDASTYGGADTGGVVRLTSTDHGFKVGADPKHPTFIYVQGTTNYDGLRRILAVAANTIDIVAPYVAETPAGTEILRPALKFDEPWYFHGFDFHLNSASATSENLVVSKDADYGAAWDVNYFTRDMDAVKDYVKRFDRPIIISPDDIMYATWANTDNRLWGFTMIGQRLS